VTLTIPDGGLVLLIGAAGSGKSTLARKHFRNTEIVSSDALRAAVSDDEGDQSASGDAFHLLRLIATKRLRRGKLTVIDATNVQSSARRGLLALATQATPSPAPITAIVLNLPLELCLARNHARTDRRVSPEIVGKQVADLADSLSELPQEGFGNLYVMDNAEDIDSAQVVHAKIST
jgi:protein phosphatase